MDNFSGQLLPSLLSGGSPEFFAAIVEHIPAPIFIKNVPELEFVLLNAAAEKFFGLPREAMLGKRPQDIFSPQMAEKIADHDQVSLAEPAVTHFTEHVVVTPGNGSRLVCSTRIPICANGQDLSHILVVLDDITERRSADEALKRLNSEEPLTGLANRLAFNREMESALEKFGDEGGTFALMSMDIDKFTDVNDLWGHCKGDDILRAIADQLRAVAPGHFICRLGGDEMSLIVEGLSEAELGRLAADITAAVEKLDIDGQLFDIGLSIGIAIFPGDGADASTLIANADAALYQAKSAGGRKIRFFDKLLARRLRERRALSRDIQTAVGTEQFRIVYQPQVRASGPVFGFEVLARWTHPAFGEIPPDVFIRIAEETSAIHAIGEWVLREACRDAAGWREPLSISVNLSALQLNDLFFAERLTRILRETGLSPRRLILELTESAVVADVARASSALVALKELGIRIALDDFGTGYSSFAMLRNLPLDMLKFDRRFVTEFDQTNGVAVMRTLVELAHELGLIAVAEGVETAQQRALVESLDCELLQGYFIGRPQPIESFTDLVGLDSARSGDGERLAG